MKFLPFLLLFLTTSCHKPDTSSNKNSNTELVSATPASTETADAKKSVVRINSTAQSWNIGQPWEKTPPRRRRSLGAIVGDFQVITTAEVVADATFLELETTDATRRARAEVVCVDYEANLALLQLANAEEKALFFAGTTALEIAPNPPLPLRPN